MMNKIFTIGALLCILFTNAQDVGGTPATGVTPIPRIINTQRTSVDAQTDAVMAINTGPTGTSTETGITEGELSVTLTGAATYNIPIAMPPGINGVVPQIGLSYNSQAGNGQAGYGWSITGLSSIKRVPSTKFHDNAISAIDFNTFAITDRFALDGQRLLVKNGTSGVYGANGTEYETESFSNLKITGYISQYDISTIYFIVQYPDGSMAQYGSSYDSKTRTEYAINYWQNPQGVRISYTYKHPEQAEDGMSISSIKYGTTYSTVGINEISFVYNISRERPEYSYITGQPFVRRDILKEIRVKGNGTGFRNYYLGHDITSLGYQRLTSITEKTGDDSLSYNPTIFSYDTTTNEGLFNIQAPVPIDLSGVDSTTFGKVGGDFDGDGKMDMILYPLTGTNAKKQYSLYSEINGTSQNIGFLHAIGNFQEIFPSTLLYGDQTSGFKLWPRQGWTVVKTVAAGPTSFSNYIYTYVPTAGTSTVNLQYTKSYTFPIWTYSYRLNCSSTVTGTATKEIPKDFYEGDFNGDGLTDIIAVDQSVSVPSCGSTINYVGGSTYLVNLDKRLTSNYVTAIGNSNPEMRDGSRTIIADYNGDGKSDIYIISPGRVRVYSLNITNTQLVLIASLNDSGIKPETNVLLMGDYNGDRKTDFATPQLVNTDTWNFFISDAGGSFKKNQTPIGFKYVLTTTGNYVDYGLTPNTQSLNQISYISNDINGDGKSDIMIQQNLTAECVQTANGCDTSYRGTPEATLLLLLENRSTATKEINFTQVSTVPQIAGIHRSPISIFTNHNQVNQNLEYSVVSNNAIYSFTSKKDSRIDVLLKGITTGNGVTRTITYSPLKNNGCGSNCNTVYYDSAGTENYPNTDIVIASSIKVVSQLEMQSATDYKKQMFAYYGAVSNVEGLGFLGFRGTMRTNWVDANNTNLISNISKNDISLRGANIENFSFLGFYLVQNPTPPNFISRNLTTYNRYGSPEIFEPPLQSNKVFKLKKYKSQSYDGLEKTSNETSFEYDIYNNPTTSVTLVKQGITTVNSETNTVQYENLPTGSPYIIGRPLKITKSITVNPGQGLPNEDTMTSGESYAYTNNLLTQSKKWGFNTVEITADNLYDIYGNLTQETISAPGLTSRKTNFEYNAVSPYLGRFLTKSTTIENLSTNFTYDTNSGVLLSEKDPYVSVPTYFSYDKWFKKIQTTDYLGKSIYFAYTKSGEKTLITTTGDDGSSSSQLLDDLGRTIQSGVKDISDGWSYVSSLYDIYGRNYKVSEPYTGTTPTLWNETQYDAYGRINKIIASTGKTITTSYSGLNTTVNENTTTTTPVSSTTINTKLFTKNAIGNIVSMTETPGGTISYNYFANGNLKSTNYNGAITTIEQDGWGRKTKLDDPSAGTINYSYNHFGELTKEITPNGTTTYTINAIGEIESKIITGSASDSDTEYEYDSVSKLLTYTYVYVGGLQSSIELLYDTNKRLVNTFETETSSRYMFEKRYEYDDFGRVARQYYYSEGTEDGKSSSKWIRNTYKNGYNWQLLDDATSKVLWQTNTVNARGQLLTAKLGNGMIIGNAYDQYGYPIQIKHSKSLSPPFTLNVMTLGATFDPQRGNLISRTNNMFDSGITDNFTYDNSDRLLSYPGATGITINQSYDTEGRISTNAIGAYAYTDGAHPYQVTTVTPANPSVELDYYTGRDQTIKYNAFKKAISITEQGQENIDFDYGPSGERAVMYYGSKDASKNARLMRKFYSFDGTMEIKRNQTTHELEFITYIGGDGYTAPIVLKSNGTTQNYLYLHRDYQGSIIAITDETAQVLERRMYDPWGSLIKYSNVAGITTVPTSAGMMLLDRGYTGHEHLLGAGLINMNGRLYDPKLHRFLSPDNNLQDPVNTQNYNRYSYCLNNPTKYSDPSGESSQSGGDHGDGNFFTGLAIASGSFLANSWNDPGFRQIRSDASNWIGQNAQSIGDWFSRNAQSIGDMFRSGVKTQTFPADSASFLSDPGNGNEFNSYQSFSVENGFTRVAIHPYAPTADIHMPTQHMFMGMNMTALSEGSFFERLVYEAGNSINIPVQFLMFRAVNDGSMRNLNGTATTSDDGIMAIAALPWWFLGGGGEVSAVRIAETGAAKEGGRAFFSGAGTEARAIEEGFQTLGQTRAGRNLQNLIDSKNIPWSQAEPMWQRLSATWAKGIPNGSSVPVFLNNPRVGSVWFQTELPILQSKGVNLIYKWL